MRDDMVKVIVVPPRRKASDRLRGRLAMDWESQPARQGMKYRWADTKSLNENLAPLRRYLITHSSTDAVPFSHAKALRQALVNNPRAEILVQRGEFAHGEVGRDYQSRVRKFFQKNL